MPKQHFYCYVDESGQDTQGNFFLVTVIIVERNVKDAVENMLIRIEQDTTKNKLKWTKTPNKVREAFLLEVSKISQLKKSLFYDVFKESKTYNALTALTIAKAILAVAGDDYTAHITIDGLTKKATEDIRGELKKLRIKYKVIRGMKDEQTPYLRLADCLAGFLRDFTEGQSYTIAHLNRLKTKGMLIRA